MGLWYLSFADATGFLGGAFIPADSLEDALTLSWLLRVNPGGDVRFRIGKVEANVSSVPRRFFRRLLSRAQLLELERELFRGMVARSWWALRLHWARGAASNRYRLGLARARRSLAQRSPVSGFN